MSDDLTATELNDLIDFVVATVDENGWWDGRFDKPSDCTTCVALAAADWRGERGERTNDHSGFVGFTALCKRLNVDRYGGSPYDNNFARLVRWNDEQPDWETARAKLLALKETTP